MARGYTDLAGKNRSTIAALYDTYGAYGNTATQLSHIVTPQTAGW
jgi:hypothetical protein